MNRPPAGGQCKGRSGKAARSPPGFQPAPRALLGVGRAAPRPPGAAAPLCALRRTGTPRDKYKRRRLPWGQNRPAAVPGRALDGLSGLGQGRGALACWGRYGPLSRFRALGTMALGGHGLAERRWRLVPPRWPARYGRATAWPPCQSRAEPGRAEPNRGVDTKKPLAYHIVLSYHINSYLY